MNIQDKRIVPVPSPVPASKAGATTGKAPERSEASSSAPAQAPAAPANGAPVTVSRMASAMVESRQVSAADVDQKKVDAVRSAIEKKTFKVNAEAIADKMLANAEEMLQNKPH